MSRELMIATSRQQIALNANANTTTVAMKRSRPQRPEFSATIRARTRAMTSQLE